MYHFKACFVADHGFCSQPLLIKDKIQMCSSIINSAILKTRYGLVEFLLSLFQPKYIWHRSEPGVFHVLTALEIADFRLFLVSSCNSASAKMLNKYSFYKVSFTFSKMKKVRTHCFLKLLKLKSKVLSLFKVWPWFVGF